MEAERRKSSKSGGTVMFSCSLALFFPRRSDHASMTLMFLFRHLEPENLAVQQSAFFFNLKLSLLYLWHFVVSYTPKLNGMA